jgi:hypothetical protein
VTVALLRLAQSQPVTQWGPRLLLTLTVVAVVALGVWGMRRGWRARGSRQADLPAPPPVPDAAADASLVPGTYVATTTEGDLLDRIVAHGLGHRGRAGIAILPDGVLVRRTGEVPLWIPRESLRGVRLGSGQAQKAYEAGGLILIAWQLGDRRVETGFRCDDAQAHVATARALSDLVPIAGGST